ncbi:hypothetical protein [Bradyrhizobium genosp. P]|uniref:hypothetical protein n=1 Tax=Bradyrhizobium genosp. P TaxID=83641 RepID=UPI003CF6DCFC
MSLPAKRIAVTGAAGQICYSLLFTLVKFHFMTGSSAAIVPGGRVRSQPVALPGS